MPNQFNASLWGDEGFSAILSLKSASDVISIIAKDTAPPLFNLIEHFWFKVFGSSEVSIRSLSFVFYIFAGVFVYKIARFLWDKKTAFLASVLTLLNPFFFIYAFEGRMYSLLAMTVAGSFYFFMRSKWVLYIIFSSLALYTHHFAAFAFLVQGLWFIREIFWGKKKVAKQIFISFLMIGILYTPWVLPLYRQVTMVSGGFWLGTPDLIDLRKLIYDYLAKGISHSLSQISLYIVLILVAIRIWTKDVEKNLFLIAWFLLPIITVFVISQKFQSIFFNRYILYTIPAAMTLIASNRRGFVSGALILSLIFMFLVIDIKYFYTPTKKPFKEFAELVRENKKGDDFLINWNSGAHHLWETKYYKIPAPIYIKSENDLPFFVGTALMDRSDLIKEIPTKLPDKTKINRIGAITSGDPSEVTLPGFEFSSVQTVEPLKIVWLIRTR